MSKQYNIGLDIGTNSIGWSVVDDQSKLIRVKGKMGYGVRLYDEGKTAEERRGFRTTRRRLKRRKWRLGLLREIFEPYITPIDASFFLRQKQSNLSPKDSQKKYPKMSLFNDQSDIDFYKKYPTIYHLRAALMTEQKQFDLREIYLAMHHIVKYRGHFLNVAPASSFKSGEFDLAGHFDNLMNIFSVTFKDSQFELSTEHLDAVKDILLDHNKSASTRQRDALPQIYHSVTDKKKEKQNKAIATEILKAILGLKAKFNILSGVEVDDVKAWTLSFNAEDFDDKLNGLNISDNEQANRVIELLRELYSSVLLAGIVPEGQSLSQSMIEKYKDHREHLTLLREVRNQLSEKEQQELRSAYDAYIDNNTTREDFYSSIGKVLKKQEANEKITEILNLIELEQFMPKQRTKDNGAIPHQLHQKELDQIIENQKQYYPWLAEINPNGQRKNTAYYKLDELVNFRVPYYVGPMITADDQQKSSNAKFAWMIRKEQGAITPWNFDDKVDRQASANEFIKRMTTTDTYLLAEDVLPKRSMIYQRFEVLNELNVIKIDDEHITLDQKQAIYNNLFLKQAHVSVKNIQKYLVVDGQYASAPIITGLADGEKFNSSLSTYHELKLIFGDLVDDSDRQTDFEKMIEWSTIFEDGRIFADKLNEIEWLSDGQRKNMSAKRYRGWGRLSNKLLMKLVDQNGQRVMDKLWDTNDNFMQIVHSEDFDRVVTESNQVMLTDNDSQEVIDNLYTSPQNKKALRQILLVVDDIQKAMKNQVPNRILIEFAKGKEDNPRLSVQRKRQVENVYQTISSDLLNDSKIKQDLKDLSNSALAKTRLFLYFMQGGRDMYTNQPLNIDDLSKYDIDHILPQAFIKDNSLDNRVLVSAKINRSKSDQLPLNDFAEVKFGKEMREHWEQMLRVGLITRKKYNNLTLNPEHMNKYTMNGFINRQLVETRQIIKLATNLLISKYSEDDVKLISVKSNLTHQLRQDFDFPKNRNVNNYHHAFDAYLTAFVGLYLLKKYPKLESYFVYGEYQKGMPENAEWRNFNFLSGLKKEQVVVENTGELIWQKNNDLAYMNKIYNFKKIVMAREVHTNNSELYNQTIYKAKDDKLSGQGARQLIPVKNNRPTALYGGYSSKKIGYMCLVRVEDKKGERYQICGVNRMWVNELGKISDKIERKARLKTLLKPQFKQNVVFDIILDKVMINQRFADNGQELTIATDRYRHNAQELFLAKSSIQLLNNNLSKKESQEKSVEVYEEILKQVNNYFSVYDINGFREKLNKGKIIFSELPWDDQWENHKIIQVGQKTLLDRILIGLHANASISKLNELGFKTDFGKLQTLKISFISDTKIIYQSPTGLFERRVALKDL
ncbi:type II CRISPR RNA-guided endonuclease Cas9 [Dellaglioa sp. L3N]